MRRRCAAWPWCSAEGWNPLLLTRNDGKGQVVAAHICMKHLSYAMTRTIVLSSDFPLLEARNG